MDFLHIISEKTTPACLIYCTTGIESYRKLGVR